MSARVHRTRLLWVLAVALVGFVVVVSRLADLQLLNADRYQQVGTEQRVYSQTLAAERGSIYDRNGAELVISKPSYSVFADPGIITDPSAAAATVAPILGLERDEVESKMRGEGRFAYLARKVDESTAQQVDELGLVGVALVEESSRHRPAGPLARSVLGLVDIDNTGLSGLEAQYGDALSGTPGSVHFERGADGRTIAVGDHQVVPAVKGDDLILTLDRSIQYEAEKILAEQVAESNAKGGMAIVSRPDTGEILAMANVARDPETKEVMIAYNNAAVTTTYEPGSVIKMITTAAALEHHVVTPDTVVSIPPELPVADAVFTDAEPHGWESWSVADILTHSSNIGTIKVAQEVGKQSLHEMLSKFGIGRPTTLGFPNEQPGHLPDPDEWWDTSIASIAIGHGASVTPLQMLQAYNVIANGGIYVEPRLVTATVDAEGRRTPAPYAEGHRVVSSETANQLNLILRRVVSEGTGKLASVNGYTPAGKTGTSWKAQSNGTYVDSNGVTQYQSTFVGFVPAEQPALSVIVVIDEPKRNGYSGGAVAAPAFSSIASFALRHLSVPPPATDIANGRAPVSPVDGERVVEEASDVVRRDADGKVQGFPAGRLPTSSSTTTTVPPAQGPASPSSTGSSSAGNAASGRSGAHG